MKRGRYIRWILPACGILLFIVGICPCNAFGAEAGHDDISMEAKRIIEGLPNKAHYYTLTIHVQVLPPAGIKIPAKQMPDPVATIVNSKGDAIGLNGILIHVDVRGQGMGTFVLLHIPPTGSAIVLRVHSRGARPQYGIPPSPYEALVKIPIDSAHFKSLQSKLPDPIKVQLHHETVRTVHFQLVSGITGQPVANHIMRLHIAHHTHLWPWRWQTTTDAQGRFLFTIHLDKKYILNDAPEHQWEEGMSALSIDLTKKSKIKSPWIVTTPHPCAIIHFYTQVHEQLEPITQVNAHSIGVLNDKLGSPAWSRNPLAHTRARGSFFPMHHGVVYVYNLPSGHYHIAMGSELSNYVIISGNHINLHKPDTILKAKVVLRHPMQMPLKIAVFDGVTHKPLVGAIVQLKDPGSGRKLGLSNTDKHGNAQFKHINEGNYTIQVSAVGYQDETEKMAVPAQKPVQVELEPYQTLVVNVKGEPHIGKPLQVVATQWKIYGLKTLVGQSAGHNNFIITKAVDGPAYLFVTVGNRMVDSQLIQIKGNTQVNSQIHDSVQVTIKLLKDRNMIVVNGALIRARPRVPGGSLRVQLSAAFMREHQHRGGPPPQPWLWTNGQFAPLHTIPGEYDVYIKCRIDHQERYYLAGRIDIKAKGDNVFTITLDKNKLKNGVTPRDLLSPHPQK